MSTAHASRVARQAWGAARWLSLVSVAAIVLGAGGCEIRTSSSPPPQHPPAANPAPAPAPAPPPPAARHDGQRAEQTALQTTVAVELGTIRGLRNAVGAALQHRELGLSGRAQQAHQQAGPKIQEARRQLRSGQHRSARAAIRQALTMLRHPVGEMAGKPNLPGPVQQLLAEQAGRSRADLDAAANTIRSTGRPDGLPHIETAVGLFANAERDARGGNGSAALRGLNNAMEEIDRGVIARWPTARAQ